MRLRLTHGGDRQAAAGALGALVINPVGMPDATVIDPADVLDATVIDPADVLDGE
ncbi:hypothetical protein [Streptomyces herbicida]|uniref:hypothetical protein n=1 Tax=Streptomyces herbicida TaxID=3065675 RepID=UPI002930502D|nr:hypothetical protein [Streptomyces sp. NEAU-HV9]